MLIIGLQISPNTVIRATIPLCTNFRRLNDGIPSFINKNVPCNLRLEIPSGFAKENEIKDSCRTQCGRENFKS
jgi:hypothetical protein